MEHITINSDRSVTVPVELRKIGVQYDHNVNTIEFVGPRYSSNVDLSTMTIYINYILSDKTPGKYKAENVIIDDQDDSLIRFNWTITRNVTKVSGILSCLVCAKKTDEEGNEINHWNTDIFRLLSVSEGMENDIVIQEQYPDIITSLIQNVEEHDAKLLEFSGLNNRVTDLENNVNELKDDMDGLDSRLSESIVEISSTVLNSESLWEVGNLSPSTGNDYDVNTRLRTKTFVSNIVQSVETTENGWWLYVYAFDNENYVGVWNGSDFTINQGSQYVNQFDFGYYRKLHPSYKFRVVLFKSGITADTSQYAYVKFHAVILDKIDTLEKQCESFDASVSNLESEVDAINTTVDEIKNVKKLVPVKKELRNTNYALSKPCTGVSSANGYSIYRCDVSAYVGKTIRLDLKSYGNYGKSAFYTDAGSISQNMISLANDGDVIPNNAKHLCFTTQNVEDDSVCIEITSDRIQKIEEKLELIHDDTLPSGVIGMFGTWSVIGTSFDCGTMYLPNGTSAGNPYMGWEHQLARRYGNNHERLAYGGARANLWLGVTDLKTQVHTPTYGLPKLISDGDKFGLIMIAMGCNDATYNTEGQNVTGISIGTLSDVVTELPTTIEKSKTFAYYYSCIICAIKKYAPSAKIICCHSFLKTSMFNEQYNNMIDSIANVFHLPVIAQEKDIYFKGSFHDDAMILTHPTGVNYSGIATAYDRLISKCCYDNYEYFKDYVGGGTEEEPVQGGTGA